jgi:branched-subunit amino acid aminotransferase/4-amino-4-deoxychorismate lyase
MTAMSPPALAVVDGHVLPAEEATIPVTDEGLLRGDGVFEVVRVYQGRPFAFDEHLRRMATSAQNLRLELDVRAVAQDAQGLLDAAGAFDGALRLLVTRAGRRIGLVEALRDRPAPLTLASVTYAPPRLMDGIKSLSYAANMLATRVAQEQGADEALLVTPHGRVLEAPTSSLFVSLDGETLITPPLSDHVLDSITRRALLELLPGAREEVLTQAELERAREAFVASTTREVQAVGAIDGAALPVVGGPLTRAAADTFSAHVAQVLGQA